MINLDFRKFFTSFLVGMFVFILIGLLIQSCSFTESKVEECESSQPATTLYVTNQTADTVDVWLTLSIFTDTMQNYYVQNVEGIFGITTSGGSGVFQLAPYDTVSYTSSLALSGNLCFGGPAINCATDQFPTGTNIFEFTLNNNATEEYAQESVEISCVSGVNSFLSGKLSDFNWVVTTGIDSVQHFHNDTLGNNRNRYGVFPTGCTDCTDQNGAPVCVNALPFEAPNTNSICIIQRSASLSGGSVTCTFNGFTNEQILR